MSISIGVQRRVRHWCQLHIRLSLQVDHARQLQMDKKCSNLDKTTVQIK